MDDEAYDDMKRQLKLRDSRICAQVKPSVIINSLVPFVAYLANFLCEGSNYWKHQAIDNFEGS
jgi:hypothetical protein